jgi:hemerythrin
VKWNSSLAIGIDAIDNQHKKIFEHLLALENSVSKRDPWHIVRFLLSQLAEYLKFHLAVEEAMLEVLRYPQHADHCKAHVRLVEQVAELEKQLQRSGSGESLVTFFEDWFIRHVLSEDRQYADYLKKEFPALYGRN